MIAANELRIGNWVNDLFNKPCRIESIDNDGYDIYYLEHDVLAYLPIKETNPIPLPPEILEKCGFVWSVYHQAFHYGDTAMMEFYDLNECYPNGFQLSTFKSVVMIGKPIFYLHQLQNLYFALTNTELIYGTKNI